MLFVVSCSKSGEMKLTHARSVMFTGQAHFRSRRPLSGRSVVPCWDPVLASRHPALTKVKSCEAMFSLRGKIVFTRNRFSGNFIFRDSV